MEVVSLVQPSLNQQDSTDGCLQSTPGKLKLRLLFYSNNNYLCKYVITLKGSHSTYTCTFAPRGTILRFYHCGNLIEFFFLQLSLAIKFLHLGSK